MRGLGHLVAALRLGERGELKYIEGLSASSLSLPEHVAERQATQALGQLAKRGYAATVEQARWDSASPGSVVFLRAVFSRTVAGVFALGARGKPAERVADEAVDRLLGFLASPGVVDVHAADQLLLPAVLAREATQYRAEAVSDHLLTHAQVVSRLTGRAVEVVPDGPDAGWVYVAPLD